MDMRNITLMQFAGFRQDFMVQLEKRKKGNK